MQRRSERSDGLITEEVPLLTIGNAQRILNRINSKPCIQELWPSGKMLGSEYRRSVYVEKDGGEINFGVEHNSSSWTDLFVFGRFPESSISLLFPLQAKGGIVSRTFRTQVLQYLSVDATKDIESSKAELIEACLTEPLSTKLTTRDYLRVIKRNVDPAIGKLLTARLLLKTH